MFGNDTVRQHSDANPCNSRGSKGRSVVGFKSSLRIDCGDLITFHQMPGFGSLHEGLAIKQFVWSFR